MYAGCYEILQTVTLRGHCMQVALDTALQAALREQEASWEKGQRASSVSATILEHMQSLLRAPTSY